MFQISLVYPCRPLNLGEGLFVFFNKTANLDVFQNATVVKIFWFIETHKYTHTHTQCTIIILAVLFPKVNLVLRKKIINLHLCRQIILSMCDTK